MVPSQSPPSAGSALRLHAQRGRADRRRRRRFVAVAAATPAAAAAAAAATQGGARRRVESVHSGPAAQLQRDVMM